MKSASVISPVLSLLVMGACSSYAVTNTWYTTKAAAFAAAKAAGKKRIFLVVGNANCGECYNTKYYWCENTTLYTGADGLKYSAKGLVEAHYICWYCDEYGPYYSESSPYYKQMPPPPGFLPHTWIVDVNTTNALDAAANEQYPNELVERFTKMTNHVAVAYTNWAALEGIPVSQRGITNCPADDGIPNLLKYACGLPATNRCASTDLMQPATATNGTMELFYYKSTNAVLSVVDPLWASSLLGNTWTNNAITNLYLGDEDGRQKWKAIIPASGQQGGVRLRAKQE